MSEMEIVRWLVSYRGVTKGVMADGPVTAVAIGMLSIEKHLEEKKQAIGAMMADGAALHVWVRKDVDWKGRVRDKNEQAG